MFKPVHKIATADYVVVGGGSAGAVIASRLSEDPAVRVVVLEAGGDGRSLMVQVPIGYVKLVGNPQTDWCYSHDPDLTIKDRQLIWPAGKMLGGGSSINGQVYVRGTRRDFDGWVEAGATGWGFDDVLPYFRKSETWTGMPSPSRGTEGPLTVSPMRRGYHPLTDRFIKACNEFGIPTLVDPAGGDMEGVFYAQATQRRGWRCSTEKAYLRPIRHRKNLEIISRANVERISFEGRRAKSVEFTTEHGAATIEATREIILSAGAMGSPAILLRSGVGPAEYLRELGIDVVHDLQGVGANLHEHPGVGQNKFVNRPTLNSRQRPIDMLGYFARFGWNRSGPLAAPAVPAMGLVRSSEERNEPDLQIHFMPLGFDLSPEAETWSSGGGGIPTDQIVTLYASLCRPKSRGHIRLDKDRKVKISHALLDDQRDVDTLIAGCRFIDRLSKVPTMQALITAARNPNPVPETDDQWTDYIRSTVSLGYHAVGTCRMGADDQAVTDPALRVRGVDGLRVADASIMPSITSTNTNAATIMIGEKAADLIRGSRYDGSK
ncbi:GMC family oxidoreductase N-terminal domain-containing protein (plasmid) [Sphingobium sp. SJ10-10]|uniref:GMC family oxidoreductase n=1 Tax=unclassified Sphingobium TaxID=2611147 RepID=UPI000770059D|nr:MULTISPECIES: GMC family oxidoreductase N-terminal domain-containing protein [unclassified Sphingobium]AMK26539.1 glucose-methanol-choline oxidoreductase [Sphingobium sp. TKS]MEC6699564.1 GMC family oxidoreductase N-terminal domain-containing protein [Sphingobium sp. SJ10-10]